MVRTGAFEIRADTAILGPEYPNTDIAIRIEWPIGLPRSHMKRSVAFFNRTHPWGHKNEALVVKSLYLAGFLDP